MSGVSRNDHLSPIASPATREVGMAMVKVETASGISLATCSCGWGSKPAKREKVAEDKAERHLKKKHGGQGLWM